MALEQYYRSFLKTPYENAGYQTGGGLTRFGSTLSGIPNRNVLFGSPTGGTNVGPLKNRNAELISGPYQNVIYGSGRGYSRVTDPRAWGTVGQDYHGQGKRGRGKLMDNYINPPNLHSTSMAGIGSRIY
jgi:hypothetical protein